MNDLNEGAVRRLKQQFAGMETSDGAGVQLRRVLSVDRGRAAAALLDPFLMLDEFASANADDYIGGFPEHPHRGFETVTYMLEGVMEHQDHLGNRGQLVPGSVQWMTAGSGIIHSEMPRQQQGMLRGFQLWINLPARQKMCAPAYQEFPPEQMPWTTLQHGGRIRMIAGQLQQEGRLLQGPVSGISTAPVYADVRLPAGGSLALPVDPAQTVITYLYEGSLLPGEEGQGDEISKGQALLWEGGDKIMLRAGGQGARLLHLAATPLHEPVVQYGPFVMNTREQIELALADYRNGRFVSPVDRA